MIRIAIVDDEKTFVHMYQKEIAHLFDKCSVECTIDTYTNSNIFQSEYRSNEYDLIFLDIDMPEVTGIEVASELRKMGSKATLVFVSNHDHFVFETFRYAPYRFVRKDKLLNDTAEMVTSFCRALEKRPTHMLLDLEDEKNSLEDLSQIMYFYSIRHDIFFYNTQKISVHLAMRTYTMDQLEEELKNKGFIRIHRTYLLNHQWILRIQGDAVYLKNGDSLPLSRGRAEGVKQEYQKLLREGGVL